MLYLLYGPDTYRSRQKLNDIIEEYRKKAGANFEFQKFDCDEDDLTQLQLVVEGGSLFSAKRLIVAAYSFSGKCDFDVCVRLAKKAKGSKEIFLVFWDRDIGKSGAAKLSKIRAYAHKEQEFLSLSGIKLEHWIREEARKRNITLQNNEMEWLLSFGGDLWRVSNELAKREASGGGGADMRIQSPSTIFSLGDAFFSAPRQAMFHLLSILRAGEDGMGIFSYLSNHVRTLFTVKAFSEKGAAIPQTFGIHPFVAKKASAIVRAMPLSLFPRLMRRFWEEDAKVKTGESNPEDSLIHILIKNELNSILMK